MNPRRSVSTLSKRGEVACALDALDAEKSLICTFLRCLFCSIHRSYPQNYKSYPKNQSYPQAGFSQEKKATGYEGMRYDSPGFQNQKTKNVRSSCIYSVSNSISSCSIDLVLQMFNFPHLSIHQEVFTTH